MQRDLFITYAADDSSLADSLAWKLDGEGRNVVMHGGRIGAPSDLAAALQRSEPMIALLSPSYLDALAAQPAVGDMLRARLGDDRPSILAVRVRECSPEEVLPGIDYLDLVNLDDAAATAAIGEIVRRLQPLGARPLTDEEQESLRLVKADIPGTGQRRIDASHDLTGPIERQASSDPPRRVPSFPTPAPASSAFPEAVAETAVSPAGPIFVVHGHDHGLLHEVVRVLEHGTSRDVIVLHELPNAGRTVLEKFEAHAASAAYAVVLLTADDVGGAAGAPTTAARGRQNVIFELGFFFGKLGRQRVSVLLSPGVEEPSDIAGLVYVAVDPHGAWRHQLARELAAADIEVAYERIP